MIFIDAFGDDLKYYCYQRQFIDVVMQWVSEAKSKVHPNIPKKQNSPSLFDSKTAPDIPKEWQYQSLATTTTTDNIAFFIFIFLGLGVCLSFRGFSNFILVAIKYLLSLILLYITAVVVNYLWGQAKAKLFYLQSVKFNPDNMLLENVPRPLSLIEKIEFITHYLHSGYNGKKGMSSNTCQYIFEITLKSDEPEKQTIYFGMFFEDPSITDPKDYDYQTKFIDVVVDWARQAN